MQVCQSLPGLPPEQVSQAAPKGMTGVGPLWLIGCNVLVECTRKRTLT